jgi:catechol 2,3-dioxygenase-like lactoylglutathione lyase family enzyme
MTLVAGSPGPRITGIHHAALRSTDLSRARVFYFERLGFQALIDEPGLVVFRAGKSTISVLGPADGTAADGTARCRPELDHIALGCADDRELRRVAGALTVAGIEHTGVNVNIALGTRYLAFADPDGIEWQLHVD